MPETHPIEDYRLRAPDAGLPPVVEVQIDAPDGATLYGYRYPRPGIAATVVVYDRARRAVLLVRRGHEPFRGALSLPGGFIEAFEETIEQTAVREIREETGIELALDALTMIDVRSGPERDPRDHVVDVGFCATVENAAAEALDETDEVRWVAADALAETELAFDHHVLWERARRILGV